MTLGIHYLMQGQHEKAIAAAQKAIELDPNSAYAIYLKGRFLTNGGRPEESFQYFEKSKRLNPYAPSSYYINFSVSYWLTGNYDEAISECQQGLERNPDDLWLNLILAASQAKLGKIEEARSSVKEAIRINPKINLAWLGTVVTWKNKTDIDDFIGTIREAGLK